jgi:hypothetical protein
LGLFGFEMNGLAAIREKCEGRAGVTARVVIEHAAPDAATPVRFGLPLPPGVLPDAGPGRLCGPDGQTVAAQSQTLARWADGSVRWLEIDGVLPPGDPGIQQWEWVGESRGESPEARAGLRVDESSAAVVIETGVGRFVVDRKTGRWTCPGDESIGAVLTDARGFPAAPEIDRVRVAARGPVRATVEIEGRFPGAGGLRLLTRLHFYAGTGLVEAEVRLHNPNRARHKGGLWDLGDGGSAPFRDFSLEATLPAGERQTAYRTESTADHSPRTSRSLEIYQDSSGGENWQSAVHVNREGIVPQRFQGYRVTVVDGAVGGRRSAVGDRRERGGGEPGIQGVSEPDASASRLMESDRWSAVGDRRERGGGEQGVSEPDASASRLMESDRRSAVGDRRERGGGEQGISEPDASASRLMESGLRAEPVVTVSGPDGGMSVAVPEFWQQFPKAIEAEEGRLWVRLFPRQFGDLFELQGGERKTHRVWFSFQAAGAEQPQPLDWVYRPAVVRLSTEWSQAASLLPKLSPAKSAASEKLELLLRDALQGPASLLANREKADEYGWRNFGEIYADHEEVYYRGDEPLVSHYNNQYDMVQGFLLHFLRTGDRRWFELGDALARHVMDIDIYHTREDKAAYSGGLFWHTDHYKHAGGATHRTYSKKNSPGDGNYGGGPAAAHNYTTGLLLYHFLTGSADARDAVIGLAEWVINMDDGRRTVFRLVDDGPTGLASATAEMEYHGPGRGPGNSVNALIDGWTLTRNRKYLDCAETLVRRCIHPADDIAARELLDVERRWSYTVFLTSLDKYLDAKLEAGELDAMYAYGRESLLHYARWMSEHEKAYFDQEEKLEYPTEAWAMQELRKANVFRRAARHADEPLRAKLLKKGDEFGDRAWRDLMRFSQTRTTARAIALVMIEGLADCVYRDSPPEPRPAPFAGGDFPPKECFVPQKQRVLRMFRSPRGLATLGLRLANPACWRRMRR